MQLRYHLPVTDQRARSQQAKDLRSANLLQAARTIAAERGVRDLTLSEVTARVGLHPSALRRYFESREELLLELAEEGWAEWSRALHSALEDRRELTAKTVAEVVSDTLDGLPLFCDLLTHVVLSLEGSARLERARQYKLSATRAFDSMATALSDAAPGLTEDAARVALTSAMSFAAYLFQLSRPTATLAALYSEEPRWAHDALRFRDQLAELLTVVMRGLLLDTPK
jgi:AcrR family transcriptional regulator